MTKPRHADEAVIPAPAPAVDYRAIAALAEQNLSHVMDLWNRRGEPCGDLRALAGPDAPERKMRRFKLMPMGQLFWVDMETPGAGSADLIGVVEWLASVDRDTAAVWLKGYLDRAIAASRPNFSR